MAAEMNYELYRIFCQVADSGSISRAASELYVSQPALSQAIHQLEAGHGVRLFLRTPKGMKLTPEGEVLYSYVKEACRLIAAGQRKLAEIVSLDGGEVRVGANDMSLRTILLPHIQTFRSLYPAVALKVSNLPTPAAIDGLIDGQIDLGIVSTPAEKTDKLTLVRIGEARQIFAAASGTFDELRGRAFRPEEIAAYPLIMLDQQAGSRRFTDSFMASHGVELHPDVELATSDLVAEFAALGMGVACVAEHFVSAAIEKGTLFEVRIDPPMPARSICLAYLKDKPLSPAATRLLGLITTGGQNK